MGLLKLAMCSAAVRKEILSAVFPASHIPSATASSPAGELLSEGKEEDSIHSQKADPLAPSDAPPGTLRWYLIRLMTSTDSTIKRLSSELLFELCGQDGTYVGVRMLECLIERIIGFRYFSLLL